MRSCARPEMPRHDAAPLVWLATRILKNLHRELKLRCVGTDTSLTQFVVRALREKLDRVTHRRAGRGG